MRQALVPILLLGTLALSLSDVLPIRSQRQLPLSHRDNNVISKYKYRNLLQDIIRKLTVAALKEKDTDNNKQDDETLTLSTEYNYDGNGIRKEQWHNYPRQLDRLSKDFRNDDNDPDSDDPNEIYIGEILQGSNQKPPLPIPDDEDNCYESIVAANDPLLMLKIRLACLKSKLKRNENAEKAQSDPEYIFGLKDESPPLSSPAELSLKVKADLSDFKEDETLVPEYLTTKNRAVKKRIFSLWSRLHSLNHKGHELQHRRHMQALYALSDGGDGGGILTAETRAAFLRPPGSPLRWG